MSDNLHTAIACGLLVVLAVATLLLARVRLRLAVLTAGLRAAVQLALVGLLLAGVLRAPWAVAIFLAVMLGVAATTASLRLRPALTVRGALPAVLASCLIGSVPTLLVAFAVPALPRNERYLLALSGIVIGNTMTACTLTGRRLYASLLRRRDEVEGWLALGATPRQAVAPLAREAIGEALLPGLDQTRTVGLVTLPGAFVGALAGGASAGGAARFQLLVLVALMAAQSLSASALAWFLGAPAQLPEDRSEDDGRRLSRSRRR